MKVFVLPPLLLTVIGLAVGACPDNCNCDTGRKVADCRNAGLTRIPWELPDPSGLRTLDLRGNSIHAITATIAPYPNLESLDLSENGLIDIEDSVFTALSSLKFLYLQNNRLTRLTQRTLQGLSALEELDLSHNEIRVLPDKIFSDLKNLESLSLDGNGLDQIREDTFLGLSALRALDLGDNRLRNIPVQALERTPAIMDLSLERNHLEVIPTHAFRLLKDLRTLNLEENEINHLSENAFHGHETTDNPELERMELGSNRLTHVPTAALSGLTGLAHLDLSQNPIRVIEPDAFKGQRRLRTVFLNSLPELQVVRNYAFSQLEALEVVEMHSNRALRLVEEDAFMAATRLRQLDLHGNRIKTIGANLADWEKLERVDIRYNPWSCDCHLRWLPDRLATLSANFSRSLAQDVKCESPDDLAGRHVIRLSSVQFVCPKPEHFFEDRIMIGIIAGICLLLFVIMLYLLYKHKYCSFSSGSRPPGGVVVYGGHSHCNGRGPVVYDAGSCSEEREAIAENEHPPGEGGDHRV